MGNILKRKSEYSYSAFRSDIVWFIHNCHVTQQKTMVSEACSELEKFVDNEISSAKDCSECYEMNFQDLTTFIHSCSKKHKLIYAKSPDFCFFPAKLMRELDDGTVSVRYFGDTTADRVNPDSIRDYSGNSPDGGSPVNDCCTVVAIPIAHGDC